MAKRYLPAPQRLTHPVLAAAVTCSGCGATLTIAIGEPEQRCACGATIRDDAKSLEAVVVAPVLAPGTNGQPKRQAQPKPAKPKYGNNPAIASADRRRYTDKTLKGAPPRERTVLPALQEAVDLHSGSRRQASRWKSAIRITLVGRDLGTRHAAMVRVDRSQPAAWRRAAPRLTRGHGTAGAAPAPVR